MLRVVQRIGPKARTRFSSPERKARGSSASTCGMIRELKSARKQTGISNRWVRLELRVGKVYSVERLW